MRMAAPTAVWPREARMRIIDVGVGDYVGAVL